MRYTVTGNSSKQKYLKKNQRQLIEYFECVTIKWQKIKNGTALAASALKINNFA